MARRDLPRRGRCSASIEHVHRDRPSPSDVCRGRFRHPGRDVDVWAWSPTGCGVAVAADREWRLEWVKFYYGLDLARAFARPVSRDSAHVGAPGAVLDPSGAAPPRSVRRRRARRIQNWIYAWRASSRRRRRSRASRDGIRRSLVASLAAAGRTICGRTSRRERNHRTLELYALFIAALALPCARSRRQPAGVRRRRTAGQHPEDDSGADGVHRERSTHYHHVVLRSFLGARENARRFGLAIPARIRRAAGRALRLLASRAPA